MGAGQQSTRSSPSNIFALHGYDQRVGHIAPAVVVHIAQQPARRHLHPGGTSERFDYEIHPKGRVHILCVRGAPFAEKPLEQELWVGSLWIPGSCSKNAFNEEFQERFAPFSHVVYEFKKPR